MSRQANRATPKNRQNPISIKRPATSAPPTISARWLAGAIAIVIAAAIFCVWGALCIMFWQGSWQLLYHPTSAVRRTPAAIGLLYEPIEFGVDQSGQAQLRGWWIPGRGPYTAVYLHGASGNLGDIVDALNLLHGAGVNIFAFDYRGYGASRFVRPNETRWREDTETAIRYLTGTRHLSASSLVLVGRGLGANLAIEEAAAHPDLGGVVVEQPIENPMSAIFNDPRARLVPAHLLVRDRWNLNAAASELRISSLWFCRPDASASECAAYNRVGTRKTRVWLAPMPEGSPAAKEYDPAVTRWLDGLQTKP